MRLRIKMIETVKIKEIKTITGISKAGRGYQMRVIETSEEPARKMSMYFDQEYMQKDDVAGRRILSNWNIVNSWGDGDTVEVTVKEKDGYLNFYLPSLGDKVNSLTERVGLIEELLKNAKKTK